MNQREKKMLILMGVVCFGGINLMLHSSYTNNKVKLEKEKVRLAQDNLVKSEIIEDVPLWNPAYIWFEDNPVTVSTTEDAQNALLSDVRAAAQTAKLIISPASPVKFMTPVVGDIYTRVRVSVSFTSDEESFYKWVADINDPQKYRVISDLKIEPTTDKFSIKVNCVVNQWISLGEAVDHDDDENTPEEPSPQPQPDTEP